MPLKRHFLKNFLIGFSELLVGDVKLMLDKVLKVFRRYLLSFSSYRKKNTEGVRVIFKGKWPNNAHIR